MQGKLYVVATPIGNLEDMTQRAIQTLKDADLIAAEDTRNTLKLLNHFDIHTPMTANHKFNEKQAVDRLVSDLLSGKNIAVVSDAGTPCINDPGYILVEAAAAVGIEVIGVCGACAAVTAISASGLPSATFCFMGFFPRENKDAKKVFAYIQQNRPELYIFYESPKRILQTVSALAEAFADSKICLCNDLSKQFERLYRGTPKEVYELLLANPNAEKGEYTLLMYYTPPVLDNNNTSLSLEALLVDVMVKQNCSMKEAINLLATDSSLTPDGKLPGTKKEIYNASLQLKNLFE